MERPFSAPHLIALTFIALALVMVAALLALLLTRQAVDEVGRRAGVGRIVPYAGSSLVDAVTASESDAALAACDLRYEVMIRRSLDAPQQIAAYYAAHFRALGWSPVEGDRTRYRISEGAAIAYLMPPPLQVGDTRILLNLRTPRSPAETLYAIIVSTWDAAACPGL